LVAVEVQVPVQAPVRALQLAEQRQPSHLRSDLFIQKFVAQTHSLMSLMPGPASVMSRFAVGQVRHKNWWLSKPRQAAQEPSQLMHMPTLFRVWMA
jgi:hypothetical protein